MYIYNATCTILFYHAFEIKTKVPDLQLTLGTSNNIKGTSIVMVKRDYYKY